MLFAWEADIVKRAISMARCAVLHNMVGESSMSEKGTAKICLSTMETQTSAPLHELVCILLLDTLNRGDEGGTLYCSLGSMKSFV